MLALKVPYNQGDGEGLTVHGEMVVPELAGFLLLSFLIQLPLLLFLLTDEHIIRLPLETAVHIIYLVFLASEITAAFFALKVMTRQLTTQFYLKQFEDAGRPWHSMSQGRAAHPGRSGQQEREGS
ncbi:mitogen-activated protein kinase kinase kinase 2 [Platysternon megacephalum]|uniref:Mitogen-activated protein kinase kinase kinase 2 n=1 Tax=Platysternon megacephalum TaxID=55544 RepID=A0A4D9E323_9SAUR|nr:mitogen-activated protein kinase kinase kinase 2 [Platysternon megacephalum]